ncbi:Uncharacterised protein [Niallia circulans]|nr:Uncharacterised protein [Niallia circulans]
MNLNKQLLEANLRELADINYRIKRVDEKRADLIARRATVERAIAELRQSQ